jgi:hypothetical protein
MFVEPSQERFYKHHSSRNKEWTMRNTGSDSTDLPPENIRDNAQYWDRKTITNNSAVRALVLTGLDLPHPHSLAYRETHEATW